jgi:CRP/FNR family cyclic AMP-dependent transcriptional regulator
MARHVERRIEALRRTALFEAVPVSELVRLAQRCREVAAPAGTTLFLAGDPPSALYVVVSGRTRAVRQSPGGREQIIHEDGPGSTFPEVAVFDGGPYPSTVVAVEDSFLLAIPREEVIEFCRRHPEVALAALRLLCRRLRRAAGMVEGLGLRDVSQRLCEYLLREAGLPTMAVRAPEPVHGGGVRPPQTVSLQLHHSNQEIADLIGSVREVVSRTFTRLQRLGWLSRRGRHVVLLDVEALRRHADVPPDAGR